MICPPGHPGPDAGGVVPPGAYRMPDGVVVHVGRNGVRLSCGVFHTIQDFAISVGCGHRRFLPQRVNKGGPFWLTLDAEGGRQAALRAERLGALLPEPPPDDVPSQRPGFDLARSEREIKERVMRSDLRRWTP